MLTVKMVHVQSVKIGTIEKNREQTTKKKTKPVNYYKLYLLATLPLEMLTVCRVKRTKRKMRKSNEEEKRRKKREP